MRAPDPWKSTRTAVVGVTAFLSSFLASSGFWQSGVVSSRPPAGNAIRWALAKIVMKTDEFVKLASSQPPLSKDRRTSVPGPELNALLQSGQPITFAEIINHPDQTYEVRNYVYGHILEGGASKEDISQWQSMHPALPLPDDMKLLLERINGIHLWADLEKKRSYFGILPLTQWCDMASWEWSLLFEKPPSGKVVMSYHDNGDFYLVLDTVERKYYWYDTEDIDRPTFIGSSIEELLSWWWNKSQELDPQEESA